MEAALELTLRSGQGLVWCSTQEENRTVLRIQVVAEEQGCAVFQWTCTEGFRQLSPGELRPPGDGRCANIEAALQAVAEYTSTKAVFVFIDFQALIDRLERTPDGVRLLRAVKDLDARLRTSGNAAVFLAASPGMPSDLRDWMALIEVPLPDATERLAIVQSWIEANCTDVACDLEAEDIHSLGETMAGMTSRKMQSAMAKSTVGRNGLGQSTIEDVLAEKVSVVRSSEVLRVVPVDETIEDVGGLGNIKGFLARRKLAFSSAAKRYGLPMPKGILLAGPPGTGKSLLAKATASILQLSLLLLDVGRLLAALVGQSEERMRLALSLAEAQAPAVLWLDEIEKAFAGVGGRPGDSGVLQRQFGYLLNWMQEHTAPVFVVATANEIRRLPPELLRKGRFDEIFFLDLPTPTERREILTVLLRKYGQRPEGLVSEGMISKLERFTGAEMEAAISDAMYNAFYDDQRPLLASDIEEAAAKMVPLADQRREEINALRQWGRINARPAS